MRDDGRIRIRSYRVVFALERRIHKVDRWRIPVPFGVPLRGVGYAAALLVAVLLLARLPLLGAAVEALHPALRLVALPACGAFLLCRWELDGRPAHVALLGGLRFLLGPRRLVGLRRAPLRQGPVRLAAVASAPDGGAARLRRGVVRGPATATLRYPVRTRARGRALHVAQQAGGARFQGTQVALRRGQRLVVSR